MYLRIKSRRWRCMGDSPPYRSTHYTIHRHTLARHTLGIRERRTCIRTYSRTYSSFFFLLLHTNRNSLESSVASCSLYKPFRKEVHSLVVILAFRHSLTRTHMNARIWTQHMKCAFTILGQALAATVPPICVCNNLPQSEREVNALTHTNTHAHRQYFMKMKQKKNTQQKKKKSNQRKDTLNSNWMKTDWRTSKSIAHSIFDLVFFRYN